MSWLSIGSVLLVCNTCDWRLNVDLQKRGRIQIGEDNVSFLYQLFRAEQGAPEDDALINRFFNIYHTMPVLCTCQNCYATQRVSLRQIEIDQAMQILIPSLKQIEDIYNVFIARQQLMEKKAMDDFKAQIDLDWAKSINDKAYYRSLGHDEFSDPANRGHLIQQFITEASNGILETARRHFAPTFYFNELALEYKQEIAEPYRRSLLVIKDLQRKQQDPIIVTYEHFGQTQPLNLNNHVTHEGTLGYPTEHSPDFHVYFSRRYNINNIKQWLLEHSAIKPMDIGDQAVMNEVRKRLHEGLVIEE